MSTTTHPFAPEEIMAHLDGELSPAQSQSVASHIESCSECSSLATSLRSSSQSLSNWSIGSVPVQLENNITLAAAKSSSHFRPDSTDGFLRTHFWVRKPWLGGLAAAAIGLVLLLFIATPNLLRSRMAANKSAAIRRQQRELAPENRNLDGQPSTDKRAEELYIRRIPSDTRSQATVAAGSDGLADYQANSGSGYGGERIVQKTERLEGPMIARTVSLSVVAKDFDSSRASLDAILARHNGYAADLNVATPQGAARSLQASLRIPALQLAAALAELKSLGRVELENQNGEEVTQQHADLVARLKNSRETEQRLQAILTQRTGKISDVLEVEQEIARVRGEIEQMEAEQKNLEHRVDFATIDLKLSEEYKAKLDSPAPAISTLIHNAAVNGYRNVADTLLSILLFFAEYGPVLTFWLLMLAVPAWLIRRRWRHATAAI
jgi:hypothetical protein